MITEFESLELNNKLYILGDFNINLLFLNKMENAFLMKLAELKIIVKTFPLKLKNNEVCSIYDFKQLINCKTRITCNTSTFTDHILTNSEDNISQSGLINTAISDHNMMYCAKKILKIIQQTQETNFPLTEKLLS